MSGVDCFVCLGSHSVEAGVHHRGRWLDTGAWRQSCHESLDHGAVLSALARHWGQEGVLPAGRRRVWLAVADVHLATATLPWSPMQWRDALTGSLAQAQLMQQGHEVLPGDVLRWADAPAGSPKLVVSFRGDLMSAANSLAQQVQARLMSVLPVSALSWQCAALKRTGEAAGTDDRSVGVLLDGQAVLVEGEARSPARLSVQSGTDEAATLSQLRARAKLRAWSRADGDTTPAAEQSRPLWVLDLRSSVGGVSAVLDLMRDAAGKPSDALDAVSRPLTLTSLQRAAMAVLVLGVSALLADNLSLWQDRQVAQARAASVTAIEPAVPRVPPLTREELKQLQQINEVVRRLNFPLDVLLTSLQPPKDIPVAILSTDFKTTASSMGGLVIIKAQASLPEDMSRYVAHVGGTLPFTAAYLRLHEQQLSAPGQPVVFSMEASWQQ